MDPISIALGLAQFAPSIMRFFGAGEKNASVAEKVISIATAVTGTGTGPEALAAMQKDSAMRYEFQQKIMENDMELEQLYYADKNSARARDVEITKTGTRNYRADAMFVLAVAVIVAMVWIIWRTPELPEYTKGIFTLVLGRFTGYLDNIYNFEFGSTRTSKAKDETIKSLSEKE